MSDPIVFIGIGFLIAVVFFVCARPFARSRVGRRAMQRLESAAPTMMAGIGADMDQLHAQIAVATRRLEISVEHMKHKTTSQLGEIARSSEIIGRLKVEVADRNAVVASLQSKQQALGTLLRTADAELKVKTEALRELEQALSDRKAQLAKFMTEYRVHPDLAKAQARHLEEMTQLKAAKADVEAQLDQSQDECARLQNELAVIGKQVETTWATERMANAVLRERINDVATEVVRVAVALEGLSSPVDALVAGKVASMQAEAGAGLVPDDEGQYPLSAIAGHGDASKATLVHRIRALRKRTAPPATA
jgi:chromosome segregation ATPase